MGFPYPGGIHVDMAAKQGDCKRYKLPIPKTENPYDFSFSGLKTAVINLVHNAEQKGEKLSVNDLAASFQHTVCDILVSKFIKAALDNNYKTIALAGGVAANSGLREILTKQAEIHGMKLYIPPISLCGDNAAMIGSQGYYEYLAGNVSNSSLNAVASLKL